MVNEKVLLIEDNKSARQAIQILLELNNINVVCTADIAHSLKKLSEENFDIVLCSMSLALPDGGNLLNIVKGDPKHYRTPVVVLAENNTEKDIRHCMNLGADDYITTPLSGKVLINSIKSRLELNARYNNFYKNDVTEQLFLLLNKNLNQELLTPINGILNSARLIEDMEGVEDIESLPDLLQVIQSAGHRMQRTTQNLRAYALLNMDQSARHIKINQNVNLREILKSVTANYSNILSPDHKKLEVQIIQDGLWEGPDELMRLVFTELIDNAVKYAQDYSIPVVKLMAFPKHFSFSVQYTVREYIYFTIDEIRPFRKFHNDLSRNGMGMGLFICKYIAEKMGYHFTMSIDNYYITFSIDSGAND